MKFPAKNTPLPPISIIIPAYNEEQGIPITLDKLLNEPMLQNAEIIVVDDGSADRTREVVAAYSQVKLVPHQHNRGYGASLKTGIRHSSYETICIIDADGTYPHECIPKLIYALEKENCHMAVGSRTGENVNIPLIRRPAKWVLNQFANMVAGETIPDLNSGLRAFHKTAALRFFNILPNGFSFTTTITLAMLTNGYAVEYIPIDYHARIGSSKIRPIRDTLNFLQLVMRIGLYFVPLKVFLPLSLLFLVIAGLWALYTWLILGKFADISTLIIFMTGIQIGVVGMLAELINKRLPNHFQKD